MLVAHERPEDMLRVMDMVRCQALAGDLTAATLYFDRLLGKSTQPIEVVETPNDLRELSDLDLARAVIDAGMGDQLPEMLRLRVEAHIVAAASGGVRVVASSVKNVQVSSKESPVSSSESAGHAV
jgi:hypothetical protein